MKTRFFLFLTLSFATISLSGCFDRSVDEQSIPWGRPASWEDQGPGMGGF